MLDPEQLGQLLPDRTAGSNRPLARLLVQRLMRFEPALSEHNGHVDTITVPLARLYDDGERVRAEVSESDAKPLFVEKADAGLTLEGWTIESPTGHLSVPGLDPGHSAETMWLGTCVAVSGDRTRGARREPYFMAQSDADAPLIDI